MIGETVSHYRILEKIGEGGMGVVYRARDTKLEREVALKFLPADLVKSAEAKQRFVIEAQTASALDHPNICTIFEIDETDDGRLFLAMAYYEGDSVGDLIASGPLEPEGALSIAQQIVQGLIKAHERGIVHRDIKPGNILITADGLVKIVDFGLAMLTGQTRITQAGDILGTVTYMSPEQIQGNEVDQRTDLWSLGIVLYEMVTGQVPFAGDYQQAVVYSIINNDPPSMTELGLDVPEELQRVIMTCLEKAPEKRYQSAQELLNDLQTISSILMPAMGRSAAALVDVTARTAGRPYPGLASFTEAEAGFFYGREAEIESLWQKLPQQPLLAVIGPSGTGKTSLLRAGVIPVRPEGWSVIMCTPGSAPFLSLRQALVPELAGDTDAIRDLLGDDKMDATLSAYTHWRKLHDETLLILDQFEELFTLNSPEIQSQFTKLLDRLSREAGVRILLSLRDDFLFSCHAYPELRVVFESLVPLGPLTGEDLRLALTGPAEQVGYKFEDDDLVDEIISEVKGERGALPLLAFAMARLWEKRDRGRHLMTRMAYEEIGGVSGALAQHAESTMDRIGSANQRIVRELFRNLVTSKTTRIARRRSELLSLFEEVERDEADAVLGELTRARLLNSYEDPQEENEGVRRVEIVHESLINSWPRLVRWQTQDEDSAQLRDEVRQAAETWDAKGRPADLLWTGTLYSEINLWKDRYPGALTSKEEEFYEAIQSRARQKRRRRITAVASCFVILAGILIIITGLLQRSRTAEEQTAEEARIAEANLLASLGREISGDSPTKAVAYALASIELNDVPDTRLIALKNTVEDPTFSSLALLGSGNPISVDISPDGKYFAIGWTRGGSIWLYHADSDSAMEFKGHGPGIVLKVEFDEQSQRLMSMCTGDRTVRIWSVPDGALLHTLQSTGKPFGYWTHDPDRVLTVTQEPGKLPLWQSWSLADGRSEEIGHAGMTGKGMEELRGPPIASPDGRWAADFIDKRVLLYSLEDLEKKPRLIGTHNDLVMSVAYDQEGEQIASFDREGILRIWDMTDPSFSLKNEFACPPGGELYLARFDRSGKHVATFWNDGIVRIWDLSARPGTRPIELRGVSHWVHAVDFHDDGSWMLTAWNGAGPAVWPLTGDYPIDIEESVDITSKVRILPGGDAVIALVMGEVGVEVWHLPIAGGTPSRRLFDSGQRVDLNTSSLAVDPEGKFVAYTSWVQDDPPVIISIDDHSTRYLDIPRGSAAGMPSFSPDGRSVLISLDHKDVQTEKNQSIRIWDLDTGEIHDIEEPTYNAMFSQDGRVITWDYSETAQSWVVKSWNLDDGSSRTLLDSGLSVYMYGVSASGLSCVYSAPAGTRSLNVPTGEETHLSDIRLPVSVTAFNMDESMLALGQWNGDIALYSLSGGKPHYMPGPDGRPVAGVDFDPQGHYLVSSAEKAGGMLRLWPMPTGPSPLDLSREDFIEYLRSRTNIRAVPDPESKTGFRLDFEPFAGWDNLPIQ